MILIDFDNLSQAFANTATEKGHRIIMSMVSELRRYLAEELRIKPVRAVAYGDFGGHGEDASSVMSALASAGVETRHVPSGIQGTNTCMTLTIDGTELLHARPDLSAFVVLSGNNWYVPFIQHLQRFGKFVLVAALDLPPSISQLWSEVSDAFLNGRFLLDSSDRDSIALRRRGTQTGEQPVDDPQERAPKETHRVEDAGAFRTLELIDEFFGQYEEVYLTPLLRKMSEMLDEDDGEPKDLVNLLQDAGVVWLEKRRGFPYDYTVLMVNEKHPDVVDVRAASADYDMDDYPAEYDDDDDVEDHEYENSEA